MRGLLMFCLVTLAYSAPQGYVYSGLKHQPHLEYGSMYKAAAALKYLQNLKSALALQQNIGQSAYYSYKNIEKYKSSPQQQLQQQYLSSSYNSQLQPQQQPIISKRFYLHAAPEDDDDVQVEQKHIILGKPKKNINVVFIRAPVNPVQRTILKISPSVNEDKTVIYVLAKKQDHNEISAHVVEPVTTTAKPEVFFIKYKTQEEAEHAQRSIKSQYETLGGSTFSSNEGVAPVSSVVGAPDKIKYDTERENERFSVAGQVHENKSAEEVKNAPNAYQSHEEQYENDTGANESYLSSNY